MKRLWNKDFILMLQGNAVSSLGDVLYSVAIGYWVYEMTGSNSLMGIMSSISMFVVMFVMPFSGSIIDKCERKSIIVGMDLIRGIIMLIIGSLAYMNKLSVPMVLLAALAAAFCSVFFSPAVSTLMLDIIPHEDMVRGQSVSSGISSFISLVGKAISGALVAFLGVPIIILLNGVSYIISAITEMFINVPKTKKQGEIISVKSVINDVIVGAKMAFSTPSLRLFIPVALLLNMLGSGPSNLMLPFILNKGFTVDQYGYLMSLETVAYLLGTLLMGAVKFKPTQRYYLLSGGFLLSIVFSIAMYLSTSYMMFIIFIVLTAFTNCLGNAVFNASLMLALPEESRGSIIGFVSSASMGGCAISAVVYGVLCDAFPMVTVFIAGQVLAILPMIYLCFNKITKQFVVEN